jgi:hypothetical protein
MAIDPTTQQPPKAALGGNQMNPGLNIGGMDQQHTAYTPPPVSGPALGGNQVAQPGVSQNPNDPTQPGYTYGAGATSQPIQGQIAGGVPEYSIDRITPTGMPVQSVGSGEQYMKQMQDAYMEQARSRLDPQWQESQMQLESQLQQQGLTRGSSAWNAEMDRLQRGKTDAYNQAMNQAILSSGAEAERMQRMGIAGGEFANKQAQQDFLNKMASQDNYNAALKEKFESNMKSGAFANAAQAQEAAQKALDAQIRNAAMGTQEAGALGREQLGLEKEKVAAQKEQFAQTFQQNVQQFKTMSAQEQQRINNQASQFAQTYELQSEAQRIQTDQFAQTLGMTGKQLDAQITQWASQNGLTREQMAQQLAISTAQMTQQDKQFYATLAETQAQRAQLASQFDKSYDLQTKAQQAQMDQFAQTLNMTGKQLDAQINQWAAQNGLSREQMANALAIASTQAQASMAAAQASAGATLGAAGISAEVARERIAAETRNLAANIAFQSRFDPLLEAQLSVNILNSGGTPSSSTGSTTPPKV